MGSDEHGSPDLGALTYEELVALLEDLARRMSSGEVGIEEAAALYERAGAVHAAASERLARVTQRLAALSVEAPGPAATPSL